MKNCDDCKYLYDLEPCIKCVNGDKFEMIKKKDNESFNPNDTEIRILFDLMKHPDKLEALANTLTEVDTCQVWESDAVFKAADVITWLSQIFKTNDDSVDTDDIAKQADAYVRDHLLIQYMMWKFGKACMLDIEDIYDEWIKWLEEKE